MKTPQDVLKDYLNDIEKVDLTHFKKQSYYVEHTPDLDKINKQLDLFTIAIAALNLLFQGNRFIRQFSMHMHMKTTTIKKNNLGKKYNKK
jgi:hypothetical protein